MSKSSTKIVLGLVTLIALGLAGLLVWGVYTIRVQSIETQQLSSVIEEASRKEVLVQSIRTLQNSASLDLAAFENLDLSGEGLVDVIEGLEETGRALELETEILSVAEAKKTASEPLKIKIVVEVIGSWESAFLFLKAIESLPNRVMFEEVNLFRVEEGWSQRVSFFLYSFK